MLRIMQEMPGSAPGFADAIANASLRVGSVIVLKASEVPQFQAQTDSRSADPKLSAWWPANGTSVVGSEFEKSGLGAKVWNLNELTNAEAFQAIRGGGPMSDDEIQFWVKIN